LLAESAGKIFARDELTFDPFRFDAIVCERCDIRRARRRSRFGKLLKIHQAAKSFDGSEVLAVMI
jgi:hypothetical protein